MITINKIDVCTSVSKKIFCIVSAAHTFLYIRHIKYRLNIIDIIRLNKRQYLCCMCIYRGTMGHVFTHEHLKYLIMANKQNKKINK